MSQEEQNPVQLYLAGKISRREFLRTAGILGLSATSASVFFAGGALAPVTATLAAPSPTAAPAASSAPNAASPKRGGILKTALPAPKNLDVAFASTASDQQAHYQWHDQFIDVDPAGLPTKATSLAANWESNKDTTVWDFEVRKGVEFHNGKKLTAKDVVFTYNRIRDPKVGAATVSLYANVQDVQATDDYHVRFTLAKPNPEFLLDLADYHAMVMDADTQDFKTVFNGTGPFIIDKYLPEDRLIFKRHPNYWIQGTDGKSLPYVDGMEWLFLSEQSAQVDALQSGQVHFVLKLTPEYIARLQKQANITVKTAHSNWHLAIHVRIDKDPFKDIRVRQALKAATDRSAMLSTAALGLGFAGPDTPIGPAYGDYYLDVPEPKRDVAKAKALLAEAGFSNGFKFTLTVQNALGAPAVATVWQQQLAEVGVTANIELIPSDVYYGGDKWTTCDAGITDWGPRLNPLPYLQLAYGCDAKWNSSHFCSQKMDDLVAKIVSEPDRKARADMYKQVQKILQDEGGTIVAFFQDQAVVYRNEVKPGLVSPFMPSAIRLDQVWLDI